MSLPNSTFSDVTSVASNWHSWEYLYHGNEQILLNPEFLPSQELVADNLPAYQWLHSSMAHMWYYVYEWLIALTESFVDNCELKEINYRTKNLSVSWTLVEMRACLHYMHSSVVLEGNIVNLGTWAMCLVCIHICLSTMGRASKDSICLGEMKSPMWDLRREKHRLRKCGPWAIMWAQLRCVLPSWFFPPPLVCISPTGWSLWKTNTSRKEHAVPLRSLYDVDLEAAQHVALGPVCAVGVECSSLQQDVEPA